ncbi:HET domain-containing protein [Mycena sanguinolenta]|uniref:HET domain-containing protein n=1 Tax=Mycena sanguinolenta TaxID=230812 RepID=A0A8H6YDB9_9AGAR|nr:HET domain-containing protein [Mycena sanguinolenta]
MEALSKSFSVMRANMRARRLFREDDGVEGCGMFHKRPEMPLHILGNILRLKLILIFAPIYIFIPRSVFEAVDNYIRFNWLLQYAITPDAVLSDAPGGGKGQYAVTEFQPAWMLEVTIRDGKLQAFQQIPLSDEIAEVGYTALSYSMDSAAVLASEAGFVPGPGPGRRKYTRQDKRSMGEYLLRLYCSATRREGNPDRTEYIWLDEFCLSDSRLSDDDKTVIEKQRKLELGKMADVFRCAVQVAVFCDKPNCDHTTLTCPWGQRLFTLQEILHAETVLRLTRHQRRTLAAQLFRTTGRSFREKMQKHAAEGNRWHLNAIYQHTVNAGTVPWQVAIHALVVEAIRRDEASGFLNHKRLGTALNGLLPRRARLTDLGNGGWNDLAWLLELNQGFYNAAGLAAVCCLSEDNSVAWLGKPIDPAAGNERLEPVVTAFPVSSNSPGSYNSNPALTIIAGETLGFRPVPLKRDAYGLYNNEEMKSTKLLARCVAWTFALLGTAILGSGNINSGVLVYYLIAIPYCIFELLVSTMYLQRDGWVVLEHALWGEMFEAKLGEQDYNLRKLTHWGERQLVPKWELPGRQSNVKLVDLRNRVYVDAVVVSRPNAMVPLAIHGSGVTCMLLDRAEDSDRDSTIVARKVGMCNVPPYIFSQTIKSGTTYVGNPPSKIPSTKFQLF